MSTIDFSKEKALRSVVLTHLYENNPTLERLRTSNEPATDAEVVLLDKFSPKLDSCVHWVENSIKACAAAMDALVRERTAIKRVNKQFRDLRSPRRNLPTEVWLEIFHHANTWLYPGAPCILDSYGEDSSIWIYGQVCQAWRHIIHGRHCAYLWSTICLPLPELDADVADCVARLEYVLERSRNHALKIKVWDDPEPLRRRPVDVTLRPSLLDVLFSHSHRWREASFTGIEDPDIVFQKLQSRLPRLEQLKFYHAQPRTGGWALAENLPIIGGFSDCPMLWRIEIESKRRVVDLPWAQITTLVVSGDDDREEDLLWYTRLLRDCSSLKTFSMTDLELPELVFDASTDTIDMITSPIEKLEISYDYILDHLTLPNLREIQLDKEASLLFSFRDLFLRSDCASKITVLSICEYRTRGEPKILLPVLIHLPNLVKLHVYAELRYKVTAPFGEDDVWISDTEGMDDIATLVLLLGIVNSDSEPPVPYLPHIQDLSVSVSDHMESKNFPYFGADEFELVKALQARASGGPDSKWAKLKRFHFVATARAGLAKSVNRESAHWSDSRRYQLLTQIEMRQLEVLREEEGMDLRIDVHVYETVESKRSEFCLQIPEPAKPSNVSSRRS